MLNLYSPVDKQHLKKSTKSRKFHPGPALSRQESDEYIHFTVETRSSLFTIQSQLSISIM